MNSYPLALYVWLWYSVRTIGATGGFSRTHEIAHGCAVTEDSLKSVAAWPGTWAVVCCAPHLTNRVRDELLARDVPAYLPCRLETRIYRQRRCRVWAPLFPGYIFACVYLDAGLDGAVARASARCAVRGWGVSDVLDVADQHTLRAELSAIQAALAVSGEIDLYPRLIDGARVRIASGPYQNIEGYIEGRAKDQRFWIRVSIMGQSIPLELDGAMIESLD